VTRVENEPEPRIVLQRKFDAPRDLVYAVWTDPEYVALWWGIEGATIPRCDIDLRPGGVWRIDMLTASGALFPNRGEFLEVVRGKRLVYTDVLDPLSPVAAFSSRGPFLCTVEFQDFGASQTLVTLTITAGDSGDIADAVKLGMPDGIQQSLDKLARLLATRSLQGLSNDAPAS
jgi:uncharacterized protein YndB with AHSA1/START domain